MIDSFFITIFYAIIVLVSVHWIALVINMIFTIIYTVDPYGPVNREAGYMWYSPVYREGRGGEAVKREYW